MKNTVLLSVFKAGDSIINLHIALDIYKEHIKEAQDCLWCHIKSTDLRKGISRERVMHFHNSQDTEA